jgi:hypothetical protein
MTGRAFWNSSRCGRLRSGFGFAGFGAGNLPFEIRPSPLSLFAFVVLFAHNCLYIL